MIIKGNLAFITKLKQTKPITAAVFLAYLCIYQYVSFFKVKFLN